MIFALSTCDSSASFKIATAKSVEDVPEGAGAVVSEGQASELRRGSDRNRRTDRNRLDVTVRIPEGSIDEDARITLSFPARNT
ncbi:MAG: hypothetical protein NUW37_15325, partial [Planctomycetes bacterium]|nr:hypothetical protein [Planctomycetota bacterium]